MAHPKNLTAHRTLDPIAADPRVVEVWDEDEDGIWIALAHGWNAEGCSCVHAWTVRDAIRDFRSLVKPGATY